MRKTIASFLLLTLAGAGAGIAQAASPEEERSAHYQEMKKIKAAQREAREARKASGEPAGEPTKWGQFWKKEGERSGIKSSGKDVGNFFKKLNPAPFFKEQDKRYKERKTAKEGAAGPS